MRRKWKLGCGATATVVTSSPLHYIVRIMAHPDHENFANILDNGSGVELVIERRAIPKVIKVLQYLEKVKT